MAEIVYDDDKHDDKLFTTRNIAIAAVIGVAAIGGYIYYIRQKNKNSNKQVISQLNLANSITSDIKTISPNGVAHLTGVKPTLIQTGMSSPVNVTGVSYIPGETITLSSEYGGGSTIADSNGNIYCTLQLSPTSAGDFSITDGKTAVYLSAYTLTTSVEQSSTSYVVIVNVSNNIVISVPSSISDDYTSQQSDGKPQYVIVRTGVSQFAAQNIQIPPNYSVLPLGKSVVITLSDGTKETLVNDNTDTGTIAYTDVNGLGMIQAISGDGQIETFNYQ